MNWSAGALALVVLLPVCGAAPVPWSEGEGFRSREVDPGTGEKPGFTEMQPAVTGVWFTNELRGDLFLTNLVAHNGAGVAIGDVDGDGWADIYLCHLEGPNRLYRNRGDWRFEEGNLGDAACPEQLSTGAAFADVDGDGDLDLLVNGISAGTRLFLNDGRGTWTEKKSGLSRTASATSLALADIDGDGDLDLYCAHYIDVMYLADPRTRFALARRAGKLEVSKVNGESTLLPRWKDRFEVSPDARVRELPEVDGFYRNDGQGNFTPIQFERGVFLNAEGEPQPPYRDWGLAVMFRDINGDRAPDLYICNDTASPDRVWINTGQGAFRPMDPIRLRHTSRSSMGIDFADIDRDGNDDFIVLDMLARDHHRRQRQLVREKPDPHLREHIREQPRYNRNMLFFGRADGGYAEGAFLAGVAASDWSWCPIFIDVDLDGYEDLLITNGFEFDVMDQDSHDQVRSRKLTPDQLKGVRRFHPRWPSDNAAYRNRGDGTFEPLPQAWGFHRHGVSHGMALGDLDNDGDLDLVVNNLNDTASLYRNDATAGRIAVRLKGRPPNTRGIGAKIQLVANSMTQSQEMISGGRYMSGDQAVRVFAAGVNSGKGLRLEVAWRNGDRTTLTDVRPNHIYEIDQSKSRDRVLHTDAPRPEPFFAQADSILGHFNAGAPYDDWARQPLLPWRLSRLGPGISWFDLDGDGWEELIVAEERGAKLALFANEQGRSFRRTQGLAPARGDLGAVVGWSDGKGSRFLLAALSNYEITPAQPSEIAIYSPDTLAAPDRLNAGDSSPGPLALADVDGDGDLDLFAGGRFRPGRYPEPVSSSVWLNDEGQLRRSDTLSQPFNSIGLVSGAAFSDLDGDGDPDLALAVEWGPVRVFRNQNGQFEEMTVPWGFSEKSGWWTSIAPGDFDGDGRVDLAAGNRGRNTFYQLYRPGPVRAFYGDWNGDGTVELIEAWSQEGNWFPIRNRSWLAAGLPEIARQFDTHQAYGKATVREILGTRHDQAKWVEARELDSGVFFNRGSHFQWMPLPRAAQLSPVFSMNVGDFDGDGIEDLFLSQNFYGTASDISRDDSGRGLWLRGSGTGTFIPMDSRSTGISVDGDQRGAALADFNHDGRLDLAVSQNNEATKLFLNQRAKRGLRIALDGAPANPDGIGAQMRVRYAGGRAGPIRSVQAGSGYWSQDAAAQVLGLSESPVELWVRWPGGKEQTIRLQDQTWDLRVALEKR